MKNAEEAIAYVEKWLKRHPGKNFTGSKDKALIVLYKHALGLENQAQYKFGKLKEKCTKCGEGELPVPFLVPPKPPEEGQ